MSRACLAECVQVLGLVMLGAGFSAELLTGADCWLQAITLGSVLFAIGCKVKGR